MSNEDFKKLVEPLCMLTGYCQSASELTKESKFKEWGDRLIELADNLDAAWEAAYRPSIASPEDGK